MPSRHAEARHHGHHFTVDVLPGACSDHQHIVVVIDDDAPRQRRTDEYITDDRDIGQALDHGLRIARALIDGHGDEDEPPRRPH